MYKFNKISLMAAVAMMASSSVAYAQAVPGSAEVSRVPQRMVKPNTDIKIQKEIQIDSKYTYEAPEGAEKAGLTLKVLNISGNTVYNDAELKAFYADELNTKISLADVYGIAAKMTASYRNDGYILTQVIVPPQTIENGVVALQVVEGFVSDIKIQGAPRGDLAMVRKYANRLMEKGPLDAKDLEHVMLTLNDLPGVTARSVLEASVDQPGGSDVTIIVEEDDFYNVSWALDNRGTRYMGPIVLSADAQVNSLFGLNEAIRVGIATAPDGGTEREMDFLSISYKQPVGAYGTTIEGIYSIALSDPGHDLSQFDIEGRAETYVLRAEHPLIRSRNKDLSLSLQFDAANSRRTDNINPSPIEDRVRSIRFGAQYQFADRYIGVNQMEAEISRGLDILGERDSKSANLTRARGKSDYTKITARYARTQYVSPTLELFGVVSGQKAFSNLLSSEEFGLGGTEIGRAYDASEVVGEDGLGAMIEVRWQDPHELPYFDTYQIFGFYDIGRVWDRDSTAANNKTQSLASIGGGIRGNINDTFNGGIEVALPLTRRVGTENDHDARIFLSLGANY